MFTVMSIIKDFKAIRDYKKGEYVIYINPNEFSKKNLEIYKNNKEDFFDFIRSNKESILQELEKIDNEEYLEEMLEEEKYYQRLLKSEEERVAKIKNFKHKVTIPPTEAKKEKCKNIYAYGECIGRERVDEV